MAVSPSGVWAARLRAARSELGWTQARTISALTTQAQASGITIAEPTSLKTMLSRWENGSVQPDHAYRRLFCLIFERDEDELGFNDDPPAHPGRAAHVAPVLDDQTVEYFRDVFWQHVRADNLMGPHHLVEVVRSQAALLDRVLPGSQSAVHTALTRLACQYNEFTGWLYQDAGDVTNAMFFTDRSMDYALATGDPTGVAYLLMRKSNIANDQGNPRRALGLAESGLRGSLMISSRVKALLLNQQARAYALTKNTEQCGRSIDLALREIARPGTSADEIAAYCTPGYLQMESAACWSELGRPDRAVAIFVHALADWPIEQRRDLGLCQSRLAIAHAAVGDHRSACQVGIDAIATARTATSARTMRHLGQLRDKLAPWRRDTEVSELTSHIRELTRAA